MSVMFYLCRLGLEEVEEPGNPTDCQCTWNSINLQDTSIAHYNKVDRKIKDRLLEYPFDTLRRQNHHSSSFERTIESNLM